MFSKLLLLAASVAAFDIDYLLNNTAPLTTLTVSFDDCGDDSTLSKTLDVTPHSLETGVTTTMTGIGQLSKDVADATFTIKTTGVGGLTIADCSGAGGADYECDLKALGFKVGTLLYKALSFPIPAGPTNGIPTLELTLAKSLPGWAAKSDTKLDVHDSAGEQVFCVVVHLSG